MKNKIKDIIKLDTQNITIEEVIPLNYLEAECDNSKSFKGINTFVQSDFHNTSNLRVERFYKPISKI